MANLRVGPVGVADDLAADNSLAIDDVGFRPALSLVEPGSVLVGVADAGQVDVMAREKAAVSGRIFIDADGEDSEIGTIVLKLEESWNLLHAGWTPGGPEIEQDDAAAIAGEMNGGGSVGDCEIGGDFAGLAGMSAAIASGCEEERRQRDQREEARKPHILIIRSDRVEAKGQRRTRATWRKPGIHQRERHGNQYWGCRTNPASR